MKNIISAKNTLSDGDHQQYFRQNELSVKAQFKGQGITHRHIKKLIRAVRSIMFKKSDKLNLFPDILMNTSSSEEEDEGQHHPHDSNNHELFPGKKDMTDQLSSLNY